MILQDSQNKLSYKLENIRNKAILGDAVNVLRKIEDNVNRRQCI
jgi:hypothetical protein